MSNLARAIRRMYATAHAPVGGASIGGKTFTGGEFIPGDVMAQASPQEKAEVEGKAPAPAEGKLAAGKESHQDFDPGTATRSEGAVDTAGQHKRALDAMWNWESTGFRDWVKGLPPDQIRAIEVYGGYASKDDPDEEEWSPYMEINNALREGNLGSGGYGQTIKGIDAAIASARCPSDVVAYRGIKTGVTDHESLVGKVIRDKAFMSMALHGYKAEQFAEANRDEEHNPDRTVFRVKIRKGTPVASVTAVMQRKEVFKPPIANPSTPEERARLRQAWHAAREEHGRVENVYPLIPRNFPPDEKAAYDARVAKAQAVVDAAEKAKQDASDRDDTVETHMMEHELLAPRNSGLRVTGAHRVKYNAPGRGGVPIPVSYWMLDCELETP